MPLIGGIRRFQNQTTPGDQRQRHRAAEHRQLAETFEFDVLISDIGLPDGSGTHLLESLNRRKGRLMRAIAMSGFGMEQDRERSLTAGFAEHLTKSVEFADLQRAITKLVRTLNAHPR